MIVYDPTGTNPVNFISNEIQNIISAAVFPINGPFTTKDLNIIGYDTELRKEIDLDVNIDYTYSPMFATVSQAIGDEVFSYILLKDPSRWTNVKLTYRAVGCSYDTTLNVEIQQAMPFTVMDPDNWIGFRGEEIALRAAGLDPDVMYRSSTEILAIKLDKILKAISIPDGVIESVINDYLAKSNRLNDIIAYIDSQVSSVKNGLFSASTTVLGIVRLATYSESTMSREDLAVTPNSLITEINKLKNSKTLPLIKTYDNKLTSSVSYNGVVGEDSARSTLTIDDNQIFTMYGSIDVNTTNVPDKSFSIKSGRTYHLRYIDGLQFQMFNIKDTAYNPNNLDESNPTFDSKPNDMFVARIIYGSLVDVTSLINIDSSLNIKLNKTSVGVNLINDSLNYKIDFARTPMVISRLDRVSTDGYVTAFGIIDNNSRYNIDVSYTGIFDNGSSSEITCTVTAFEINV